MVDNLTCEYCDASLNSNNDLRYHLSHTKQHEVLACCGRFFKREEDFDNHVNAEPRRFGCHMYQIQRNLDTDEDEDEDEEDEDEDNDEGSDYDVSDFQWMQDDGKSIFLHSSHSTLRRIPGWSLAQLNCFPT